VSSLKALSRMNIPMYVIFKRCVPLVNLMLSFLFFQKKKTVHTTNITASILLMTFGVILAGLGDIAFDANAYLYCGFSVICQALYFTSIQKCGETQKNPFQALFNSSCISWPVLMFCLSFTGEMHSVLENYDKFFTKFNFNLSLLVAILCGSTLCFSQFYCTMNNNAVTTSVIGVLKSVVQTGVGMFVFTDFVNLNALTLLGISINLIFGTWYTYLKYIEDYHAAKDTSSTV
jgi:solute carrier family 35 protein